MAAGPAVAPAGTLALARLLALAEEGLTLGRLRSRGALGLAKHLWWCMLGHAASLGASRASHARWALGGQV